MSKLIHKLYFSGCISVIIYSQYVCLNKCSFVNPFDIKQRALEEYSKSISC